jgi:hypothetical protein
MAFSSGKTMVSAKQRLTCVFLMSKAVHHEERTNYDKIR